MPAKDSVTPGSSRNAAAALSGAIILLGIGLCSFGCWMAWRPGGFICLGIALAALGLQLGRTASLRRRT
jgi:hypothetical protein